MPLSVNHVGNGQNKKWDRCFKLCSVGCFHGVGTAHITNFAADDCSAGIFKRFSRLNNRLLADHSLTIHFFYLVVLVSNYPVPVEQSHWFVAVIENGNRIGKRVGIFSGF